MKLNQMKVLGLCKFMEEVVETWKNALKEVRVGGVNKSCLIWKEDGVG